LFTRIFSVADYGIMNLVGVTLTALVAVGKLGLQHAVVRFHGTTASADGSYRNVQLVSTAIFGMTSAGVLIALAWFLVAKHLPLGSLGADPRLGVLLSLIAALGAIEVAESSLVSLLRASQRSGLLATYQVLKKYLVLSTVIVALFVVRRELTVFYTAQTGAEAIGVVLLGFVMFRSGGEFEAPRRRDFSTPLLRGMLRYGVPMMLGWELSGVVLSVGDRYVIQGFLGPTPLGTYAAAYNLCQYVETVLVTPWGLAIQPIYVHLWEREGAGPTKAFLERALAYYVMLAMPVVAGLSAIGPDLLAFLASEKYRSGAVVIPWVIAGLLCNGAVALTAAGSFIGKRTWVIARYVALSAALNLGLNLVLVPSMGIKGAAIATLLSYAALLVWLTRAASRHLVVDIPWATAGRAAGAALLMYALLTQVSVSGAVRTIGLKVGIGVVAYSSLILLFEQRAREGLTALFVGRRGAVQ
jgi:O-antigen/teichoic acid export membrane protein